MQINGMVPGAMQVSLTSTPHGECEELVGSAHLVISSGLTCSLSSCCLGIYSREVSPTHS